jgi:seryl-tRNA synthetase
LTTVSLHTSPLIKSTGGDPEKVKKSERERFRDDAIVDQIIEIDARWRKSKFNIFLYARINFEIFFSAL